MADKKNTVSFDEWANGAEVKPAKTGILGRAGDLGLSALKSAIAVPETAVGLANLVSGGKAGKAVESAGIRFKDAKDILDAQKSDAAKDAEWRFQNAEGFTGKLGAAVENPSLIANTLVESAAPMLAGGVVGRGISMAAPRLAGYAGAIGEGAIGAGSAAEQIRQESTDGELSGKQAALAGASGLATGLLGYGGSKLASRLGVGDIDTALAGGARTAGIQAGKEAPGMLKRIGGGALSEGVFEELPQSVSEQMLQNVALDRDPMQGVDAAAAMGLLSGGLMGGGMGIVSGQAPAAAQPPAQPPVAPSTTPGAPPAATPPAGPTLGQSLTGTPMADLMGGGGLTGGANPLQAGLSTLTSNNQMYPGMNTEPTGYTVDPETGAIIPAEPVGVRQMAEPASQVEAPAPVAMPAVRTLGESLTGTPVADMLGSGGMSGPANPLQSVLDTSTPSQRMGLNPAAGGLTAAAAIAVDSGASPVTAGMGLRALSGLTEVTPIERTAGQIGATRRLGESPIIDVQAREVRDPELQWQQSRIGMTPRIGFDQPQETGTAPDARSTGLAAPQNRLMLGQTKPTPTTPPAPNQQATPAPEAGPTNQGATNGQGQETLLKAEQPTGAAAMVSGAPVAEQLSDDPLLNKLATGYGYQGGIDTMPDGLGKTARKLHKAIIQGDEKSVQEILHPDNKQSRKAFEKLFDGRVKLPSTVKGTKDVVKDFIGKVSAAVASNEVTATTPSDTTKPGGFIEKAKKAAGKVDADTLQTAMDSSGWAGETGKNDTIWTKRSNGEKYTARWNKDAGTVEVTVLDSGVETQIASFKSDNPKSAAALADKAIADDKATPVQDAAPVQQDENDPEMQAYESGLNADTRAADMQKVADAAKKPAAKPAAPAPAADSILDDELKDALGKLGDVLGDVFGSKLNVTGPQYTAGDLLPALSKVVELLVKKGFKSFSQSIGKAAQLMRADQRTAAHVDSISPRQWKAAYNAIADGFEGTDSEDAISAMKSDEVLAIVAPKTTPAQNPQTTPENENATPDEPDQKALENLPAKNDGKPEVRGEAGTSPASGSEPGGKQDSGADGKRVSAARSGRGGSGRVSNPEAGAARVRRPRGAGTDGAGAGVPEADGGLNTPETTSAPNIPATNFAITPDLNLGVGGEVAKFNDNISAIKTLKAIEGERRRATPDEQRALARFVGWGGLANAFPNPETGKFKPEWEKRGNELRELLTPSEYRAASRSTRNAHYTSEVVVGAMWDAVRRLGYRNGLALESSMGSGNFLGLMPSDMAARFIGVEYDSITARLAGALYPQATVLHSGFQDVALPDGAFDLDIGNPPFGSESLRFQYKPELRGVSIHNQFFRAGVDALRPGGLKVSVVSSFLMDSQDSSTRIALAGKAKLVAAIRLPSTAFKENARTDVVTDIIILQRRSAEDEANATEAVRLLTKPPSPKELKDMGEEGRRRAAWLETKYGKELSWVTTSPVADPLGGEPMLVNDYFAQNPGQIVGTMDRSGTMRTSGMMNVRLDDPKTLGERLSKLVAKLPQDIVSNAADVAGRTETAHKLLGEAMRISVARHEPGHVSFDDDGKLTRVIEREYGDGTVLQNQAITPQSPWSAQLFMDSMGRWYKVDVRTDADGKPVKLIKDGKPTKFNDYIQTTYEKEADVPDSLRLGQVGYERMVDLVGLRDLLKRQLVLETEDAPNLMMEGNRKKLAKAYQAFVDKHGPINRRANAALVSEMPDGGLVLALESSYEPARTAEQAKKSGLPKKDETVKPAPIMRERVVPKYEPATSADTPADALAITLAERGVVDVERIAALLKQSPEDAEAALTSGDKPLIFKDPETNTFETANAYLSGQVRRKLMAAKSAGLAQNVKALEAVQPERWGAENVSVQLGASWVPPKVYSDFAEHLMGGTARVRFSALTNTFSVDVNNTERSKAEQWDTERMSGVTILGKLLNSQSPTVTYTDSEGKTHTDKEATTLAILKGREIVAEFGDWVFKDGDRRDRLVEVFNDKFNTRVTRQYDGQHLKLPGKVPDQIIKMRRHQMNAIWRGISSRSMLVDHAVGAGKTFTAIARAMERRRMGLAQKPTVVVPNHLVEQWAADVYRLYPAAKVLAATKKDFEKKNRRRLLSRVATGDYDIVILPHSSFGFVGISPETELRYLEEELKQALAAVKEAEEQAQEDGSAGFRKPMGVKEAERLVAKIESRMASVREGTRDRLLTFEQLGIDDLTIDEAHEFKNLFYSSRLTKVRGMGDKMGSRKAADLYNKVRVLRDNGGAVTFMTGTPVSNSVVELYTMMRYLAPAELREMGMEHFDAWRAQFVDATPAFEPNESGRLQEVTRLGRTWSNMRNLMDLYYGFTDAVTNDDIKQWYREDNKGKEFPIPKVKGGERQLVKVKPTPAQESYLKEIIAGFDSLPDIKDVQERNAERLRLMDRARKLSLDIRAALPGSPSKEEGGKLDQIAAEVKRIYAKSTPDLGTQLVFLDRSVPKAKGDDKKIKEFDDLVAKRDKALKDNDDATLQKISETLETYDAREIEEMRRAQAGGWNAYQQLKDNLIALGIPAAEIKFVQDANTDEQKQALFDAVNGGKVRVLIGSTPRMGAGTNVQQRMVGLHHADVTWKPSDIEQREGRIIRQGNLLLEKYGDKFEVEILAYATERTVDAKMWSLNATKLKAINGLRKYTGDFTMDLDDEESVSMAEMAALASGNPLLLERVTLDSEIQNLELQERAHRRKLYGAQDSLRRAKQITETYPGLIEQTRQLAKQLTAPVQELNERKAARRVTVEGATFDNYKDAMKAAAEAVAIQQAGNEHARYSIEVNGQRLTNKSDIDEAVAAGFGDAVPFEVEIQGETFTQRTAAGRVVAAMLSPKAASKKGGGTVGSMMGMELKYMFSESGGFYKKGSVDVDIWLERDGKTIASNGRFGHDPAVQYTTAQMRDVLGQLLDDVVGKSNTSTAGLMQGELDAAKGRIKGLEERVNEPFPKAQELKAKRQRLNEVVGILTAPVQTEQAPVPPVEAKPSISRAKEQPLTPASTIRSAITKAYGNLLDKLEGKGLVTIAQTEREAIEAAAQARADKTGGDVGAIAGRMMSMAGLDVKYSANGNIEGFFDRQTGKSFLVADNLTAASAPGTLMHEVGIHMAADGKLEPLFKRAGSLLKTGAQNEFIQRVKARMARAGETSDEEAAAYIVTEYENDRAKAPITIGKWLADLTAAVRAWLFSKGVILKAEQLTIADIAAVARANARSMARGGPNGGPGGGQSFSRTSSIPATMNIDGKDRPTANSNGQPIAATEEGVRNFYRWFGDSKVVDEQGRPLVVYHGTAADITEFKASERGTYGSGIYLTPDAKGASDYAIYRGDKSPTVYQLYVSIKNPATGAQATNIASWQGEEKVQAKLIELGHDGIVDKYAGEVVAFNPTQVKSATGNTGAFSPTDPDIRFSRGGGIDHADMGTVGENDSPSSQWDAPLASSWDDKIYKLQDKNIDTKRVIQAIKKMAGDIQDKLNVYLQEELYHGRTAKRVLEFGRGELNPALDELAAMGYSIEDLEEYMHARHAPEANVVLAARNPTREMIDTARSEAKAEIKRLKAELSVDGLGKDEAKALKAELKKAEAKLKSWTGVAAFKGTEEERNSLSGMKTEEAEAYFRNLPAEDAAKLKKVAEKMDAIMAETSNMMVAYHLESQETVDGWNAMYRHYIPLHREGKDDGSMGTGQGFSIKGREVKGRTGSKRKVVNIVAHIAEAREKTIVRGEKNRVAQALVGLVTKYPNADFWKTGAPPSERVFDRATGKVKNQVNPAYKSLPNVVMAKVMGEDGKVKEVAVTFNENDERAVRMAGALKNLDTPQIEGWLGTVAKATRYFAAVNTQFNPIFGAVNLVRDVQGAMINLGATPLADQKMKIARDSVDALAGIYRDIRATRRGEVGSSRWSELYEQFQHDGGQTGFRNLFETTDDRSQELKDRVSPTDWAKTPLGRIMSANGKLTKQAQWMRDGWDIARDWLSDYNETMESATRLAVYKAALDKGMTREQAASMAKNITVNFNRKGTMGTQAGALYAFFNAAMQGTARMGETLVTMEPGQPKTMRLSAFGKKVVYGGVLLGAVQALALAAGGFGDEEPPDFERERNLLIPTGWTGVGPDKGYIKIPMPLGLHVIPGIGRMGMEFVLSGGEDPAKAAIKFGSMMADAFNPIGNAGLSMQTIAPTVLDPLAALVENKDWTGKNIARESFNKDAPMFSQHKDSATFVAKFLAELVNYATGGNEYVGGALNWSPDQIDYLIGQVTGGVGRELSKVEQTATGAFTGDETPIYKVPLLGRFAGSASGKSGEANAFYTNADKLNRLETELKGMVKDGKSAEAAALRMERPESRLIVGFNMAERQVQKLRKQKSALIEAGASAADVRAVDERITAIMQNMNQRMLSVAGN